MYMPPPKLKVHVCLLLFSLPFHLIQFLQHPAEVSHPIFCTDVLIIFLIGAQQILPELWVNFTIFPYFGFRANLTAGLKCISQLIKGKVAIGYGIYFRKGFRRISNF